MIEGFEVKMFEFKLFGICFSLVYRTGMKSDSSGALQQVEVYFSVDTEADINIFFSCLYRHRNYLDQHFVNVNRTYPL